MRPVGGVKSPPGCVWTGGGMCSGGMKHTMRTGLIILNKYARAQPWPPREEYRVGLLPAVFIVVGGVLGLAASKLEGKSASLPWFLQPKINCCQQTRPPSSHPIPPLIVARESDEQQGPRTRP